MDYIEALGFAEVKIYELSDFVQFMGRRMFRNPKYGAVLTVDNSLNICFIGDNADEINQLETQVANIFLGENSYYLAPFMEFNPTIITYLCDKYVLVELEETEECRFEIKIDMATGQPRYLVEYPPRYNDKLLLIMLSTFSKK